MKCLSCSAGPNPGELVHVCAVPTECGCGELTCLVRKVDIIEMAKATPPASVPGSAAASWSRIGSTCHCDGPAHQYSPGWCPPHGP